jgi:hypothetical protein
MVTCQYYDESASGALVVTVATRCDSITCDSLQGPNQGVFARGSGATGGIRGRICAVVDNGHAGLTTSGTVAWPQQNQRLYHQHHDRPDRLQRRRRHVFAHDADADPCCGRAHDAEHPGPLHQRQI